MATIRTLRYKIEGIRPLSEKQIEGSDVVRNDLDISVYYVDYWYKLVLTPESLHKPFEGAITRSMTFPNDGALFRMIEADRYNKKFHQRLFDVVQENAETIKNWYLGNRESYADIFTVINAAIIKANSK